VNEKGDVGVDGSLSVSGAVYINKWATIASDGTSSRIYMRGSGNPTANNVDVDIAVTGGVAGQADQGVLMATSKGVSLWMVAVRLFSIRVCIYQFSQYGYLSLVVWNAVLQSYQRGAQQVPAAQMDVQGGSATTPNQRNHRSICLLVEQTFMVMYSLIPPLMVISSSVLQQLQATASLR
jgi:hypothetical protein